MKTSSILAAAVLSFAAVGAAQAEQYQGVISVNSTASRAEVQQQALAAKPMNAYQQEANAYRNSPVTSQLDRATVRAGAVAEAHNPTANLNRGAFVNSQIPAQYTNGSLAVRSAGL